MEKAKENRVAAGAQGAPSPLFIGGCDFYGTFVKKSFIISCLVAPEAALENLEGST
jgi:hypothetical protein